MNFRCDLLTKLTCATRSLTFQPKMLYNASNVRMTILQPILKATKGWLSSTSSVLRWVMMTINLSDKPVLTTTEMYRLRYFVTNGSR